MTHSTTKFLYLSAFFLLLKEVKAFIKDKNGKMVFLKTVEYYSYYYVYIMCGWVLYYPPATDEASVLGIGGVFGVGAVRQGG